MAFSRIKWLKAILLLLVCVKLFEAKGQLHHIGIPEVKYYSRQEYGAATQNWKISQNQNDLICIANHDGLLVYNGEEWETESSNGPQSIRSVKAIGDKIYVGAHNELGYFSFNEDFQFVYTSLSQSSSLQALGDYWEIESWHNQLVFRAEKALVFFEDNQLVKTIFSDSRFLSLKCLNNRLWVNDEVNGLMEVTDHGLEMVPGGHLFAGKQLGAILKVDPNTLLIVTRKDGLYRWDSQGITLWPIPAAQFLKEANVYCGTNMNDAYYVFGTIQSGLVVIDKAGDIVLQIGKDKGLKNNTVLDVFVDREGNIWCGLDNGIAKVLFNSSLSYLTDYYDIGTGYAFSKYNHQYYFGTNQGLYAVDQEKLSDPFLSKHDFVKQPGIDGQIWTLFDFDNRMLIGSDVGAFELQSKQLQRITPPDVNGIWTFKPVPANPNLVIAGTYGGICLFEKTNGQWSFKSRIKGFDKSVRQMEWDNQGGLWVGQDAGWVLHFQFEKGFQQISRIDTVAIPEAGQSMLFISRIQNRCVIAGTDGVFVISKLGDKPQRLTLIDKYFRRGEYPRYLKEDEDGSIWYFQKGQLGVLRKLEDNSYQNVASPFEPITDRAVLYFETCFSIDPQNVIFNIENGFAHYTIQDQNRQLAPFKVHIVSFKGREDSIGHRLLQQEPDKMEQHQVPHYQYRDNQFEVMYAATQYGVKTEYSTFLKGVDSQPTAWSNQAQRAFSNLREGSYTLTVWARNQFHTAPVEVQFQFVVLPPWYRTVIALSSYLLVIILIVAWLYYLIQRRMKRLQEMTIQKQQQQFSITEEQLRSETFEKEQEVNRIKSEKLKGEIDFKEKEFASLTLHILKKVELLTDIKEQLIRIRQTKKVVDIEKKLQNLIEKVDGDIENEDSWREFASHLEQVHSSFLERLLSKHPDLTEKEQRLCAYIRAGLASKDIAYLMNLSSRSVDNIRYKLRQRLQLSSSDNLSDYILEL
jgi:DNA-binding CsgD family transcriptional regulator/ligand-binding sensor domain-containing protein